jgi:hypothetical protein
MKAYLCRRFNYVPLVRAALLTVTLVAILYTVSTVLADEPLSVAISRIETRVKFPQVTAYVTVLDSVGVPVLGLTQTNFKLKEANQDIPGSPVAVEPDISQPVQLVLALDLSVHQDQVEDLAKVKEAAQALLDTMGSQVQITLLTFEDQVIVRATTASPAEVRPIIASLQPVVNGGTAFYEAAYQSAQQLAGGVPTGQAVVMVTNKGNNIEGAVAIAAKQAIFTATNRIPIHVISFGSRAKLDQLEKDIAGTPQVEVLHVPNAGDLPAVLRQLGPSLQRPGYKITFQPWPSDDPKREVLLEVTTSQGTGSARQNFDLQSRVSKIRLWGIQPVTVGKTLVVTAEVEMPGPVESVSYQLGQTTPITATELPYAFIITAAITPGDYTLTTTVLDELGYITSTQQTLPVITGIIFIPRATVYLNDRITLEAQVPDTQVSQVEFWRDKEKIDDISIIPYRLIFGPGDQGYPDKPGKYVITARVIGAEDQAIAEEKFTVEFLARPEPDSWGEASVRALLVLAANLLILPWLVAAWGENRREKWRQLCKTCHLEIKNRGNVPTAFRLSVMEIEQETTPPDSWGRLRRMWRRLMLWFLAKTPARGLQFQFSEIVPTGESSQEKPPASPTTGPNDQKGNGRSSEPASMSASPEHTAPNGRSPSSATDKVNNGIELAELLSAIPLVGRPFRAAAGQLRQTQSEAGRLQRQPEQITRPVCQLITRARNAFDLAATQTPAPSTAAAGMRPSSTPSNTASAPAESSSKPPRQPKVSDWGAVSVLKTSVVEPTGTLSLKLFIQPKTLPGQAGCYRFRLTCRPADPADEADQASQQVKEAGVQINSVFWWYRRFWVGLPILLLDLVWLFLLLVNLDIL